MKASAGSLVVARPRTTRLRRRATDLCGSLLHFRYEPAARTSFMKALAATKDGSVCSQVSRFCHNVSNGTGTLPRRQHLSIFAPGASLDDLREAVTTLEDAGPIARRVLGGAHPLAAGIEAELRCVQAALEAREAPPTSA